MIATKDDHKISRLMGLIIMLVSKNFKSNRLLKIFVRSNWYFEHFCEILESTGDERILGKCENYP